ncbi:hypothetical protein [Streptomyces hygroscopicus]|uniref:hypothetical protein n=1 Tax=Streptomyces hygroscopicus TaxID=1912 RepID=UPI000780BA49|nr:hypothetical protein [Streptomyces hygroscopicus]
MSIVMPIACAQCRIGPYARLRAALYACQRCGAQRRVAEFELASGERLTVQEGRLCIQRDRAVPGIFTVEPTHGVQAPYLRATLHRALLHELGPLTQPEQVEIALRLREATLTDRGPWSLTGAELGTLVESLRWRRGRAQTAVDPHVDRAHENITKAIASAYEDALRALEEGKGAGQ